MSRKHWRHWFWRFRRRRHRNSKVGRVRYWWKTPRRFHSHREQTRFVEQLQFEKARIEARKNNIYV